MCASWAGCMHDMNFVNEKRIWMFPHNNVGWNVCKQFTIAFNQCLAERYQIKWPVSQWNKLMKCFKNAVTLAAHTIYRLCFIPRFPLTTKFLHFALLIHTNSPTHFRSMYSYYVFADTCQRIRSHLLLSMESIRWKICC